MKKHPKLQTHNEIANALRELSRGFVTRYKRYVLNRPGLIPCFWCHRPTKPSQRQTDHVIPLRKGGPDHVDNIVCSCIGCNTSKGNRPLPNPWYLDGDVPLRERKT